MTLFYETFTLLCINHPDLWYMFKQVAVNQYELGLYVKQRLNIWHPCHSVQFLMLARFFFVFFYHYVSLFYILLFYIYFIFSPFEFLERGNGLDEPVKPL